MTFYVGQKVVCIDDNFDPLWKGPFSTGHIPILPTKGSVYTIRRILPDFPFSNSVALGILLEEIVNAEVPLIGGVQEHPFGARRFRPVVERKTDISVFTEILDRENAKKQRVRAVEHQS